MRRFALLLALLLLPAIAAQAQSDQEARLREALRRATADLRALQDGQARLQAEAAEAKAQRDRLQTLTEEQATRLKELEEKPAGPPPEMVEELEMLRAAARALKEQNDALAKTLAQWQVAHAEAVSVARTKEGERAAYEASFGRARAAIEACEAKNTQLLAAAGEILNLYQTPDFRSLVLRSQEPILGLWRVRLENIVQEHEDRIREGQWHRPAIEPPPPASALPRGMAGGRAAPRPRREAVPQ